ncbi:hypothetical protein F5Y16DRAFT_398089 [Xylariaceae sp. FL0255]|nr:hypothetical protein F5Y16DRAFT_398089 [Xylariaceae sp. FL0255]
MHTQCYCASSNSLAAIPVPPAAAISSTATATAPAVPRATRYYQSQPASQYAYMRPGSFTPSPPNTYSTESTRNDEWYALDTQEEPTPPPKDHRSSSRPQRGFSYDSLLVPSATTSQYKAEAAQPSETSAHTRPKQHRLMLWYWEVGAVLLSLASFATIIAFLRAEDGKPLDEWSWHSISPTAVVSFITVIAKSSMLLAVSEIIGQLKWHHFRTGSQTVADLHTFDRASRGPLVISALFIDPFMQLIFSFPSYSRPDLTATGLFNGSLIYDMSASLDGLDETALDPTMASAILTAAGGTTLPTSASCSTGNCTWSSMTMLGVCGSCTNVTDQVKCPEYRCWSFAHDRWNSSSLDTPVLSSPILPANSTAILTYFDAVQIPADPNGSLNVLQRPVAWTCAIDICAKTYDYVNITDGQVSLPTPREETVYIVRNMTDESPNNTSTNFYYPLRTANNTNTTSSINNMTPIADLTFKINDVDYHNMAEYLQTLFQYSWIDGGVDADEDIISAAVNPIVPNLGWEFDDAADLNKLIENMATAMTEVIRNSQNATNVIATAALRTRTYIEVQWIWLIYPLATVLLSALLVVAMVVRTALSDVPVWKNSVLSLLTYKIPAWTPSPEALRGPSRLKREAKGVEAVLSEDPENLVFTRT